MNCSAFFSFNNVRLHLDILLNYNCQNAHLTRVSLALLEEFASRGTIYHYQLCQLELIQA